MNRRGFLVSGVVACAAGCLGSAGGERSTPTPSTTPTPTETPGDGHPPRILGASPVSEWSEWGDVHENSVDEASGPFVTVAHQMDVQIHDGEVNYTVQVELHQTDGGAFSRGAWTEETLVDADGRTEWESATDVPVSDLPEGEYHAEVIVREEPTGGSSRRFQTEPFDLA